MNRTWEEIFVENCGPDRLFFLSFGSAVALLPLSFMFSAATIAFFRKRKIFHPLFSFCFLVLLLLYWFSTAFLFFRNAIFSFYGDNFGQPKRVADLLVINCERIYMALNYFIPPMILLSTLERLLATVLSKFYEKSRLWSVLVVALTLSSLMVYIEFDNRHSLQATVPTRNVQLLFAIFCSSSLFLLLIANRSKSKKGRAKSALSERYQVTENLKALRILIPVVCLDTAVQFMFLVADLFLNVAQVLNLNNCYEDDLYFTKFFIFRMIGFSFQYLIPFILLVHFSQFCCNTMRRRPVRRLNPISPSPGTTSVVTIRNVFGMTLSAMSIDELSAGMNGLVMDRSLKHQDSESADSGNRERGNLTRKSSVSSTASSDKKRNFNRMDSEVKIEAIFKELFSPDAKIIDHYEGDVMIPGIQFDEVEDVEILVPNHDRFKLRRQTSLKPKEESNKKNASPQPRLRVITRKSPSPLRKLSTPTAPRKRSTSSRAPLPKLSAPPSLKPNFVTVSDDSTAPYLRKNAIPLRRGLSIAQK